jgi:hypothetical protein
MMKNKWITPGALHAKHLAAKKDGFKRKNYFPVSS